MGVMVGLFPLHYWGRVVVMTGNGQTDGIPLNGGQFAVRLAQEKGQIQGSISIAMRERIS